MQIIRDKRGVSKVIGTVLLVVIVIILAAASITMATGFSGKLKEPATTTSVTLEEGPLAVLLKVQAAVDKADTIRIKVNGATTGTWADFSAGEEKKLSCLKPGDTVTIIGVKDDGTTHTLNELEVSQRTECRFKVKFADSSGNIKTQVVSPINWDSDSKNAGNFYSYGKDSGGDGHPHAHINGYDGWAPENDGSYMFFYEYKNELSLIVVHDRPKDHTSDKGGGAVDMRFGGVPSAATWVTKDDEGDWGASKWLPNTCDSSLSKSYDNRMCFAWAERHTDGGILSGKGSLSGDTSNVAITVDAVWNGKASGRGRHTDAGNDDTIDSWEFVYATESGPESVELSMVDNETVYINGTDDGST